MESGGQTKPVTWLELSVACDSEAVEPVSELLARYGYNGGVAIEPPIIPGEDGPEYQYDPARPVTVRTYLALDETAEETRARIEQGLWLLGMIRPVGPLQIRQIEEEDWANAWKQYYTIQRIGARIVIVPSWLDYQPLPEDLLLRLDPGMAFGTGLHPTTQLCLIELERRITPGDARARSGLRFRDSLDCSGASRRHTGAGARHRPDCGRSDASKCGAERCGRQDHRCRRQPGARCILRALVAS